MIDAVYIKKKCKSTTYQEYLNNNILIFFQNYFYIFQLV